jgi:hypothetical protein
MYHDYNLSSKHYAAGWKIPDEDHHYDLQLVNDLAINYSRLKPGPEKEELGLKLLEMFNPYLKKYLNMIISGQCPSLKSSLGKEASLFLRRLCSPDEELTYVLLSEKCKMLHLAFKSQTTDDIYDIMVLCFLRVCNKYDPDYVCKIKEICEIINAEFSERVFTHEELNKFFGFDPSRYLNLLVRKQYLSRVYDKKKKLEGFQQKNWPPKQSFFESGPIGFVYFLQMWFRHYLSEYIKTSMNRLETKQGVLQLDYRSGEGNSVSSIPDANGAFVAPSGVSWSADTSLMSKQFDISQMGDSWVRETDDKLFRNLSRSERWLLQMVFVKECSWVQIAVSLGCDTQTAHKMYNNIMFYLQSRANFLYKKS